ncbi:MAG: DRTGG domain-containing protein [Firmicutes bacterium]|nr:DRTGG domain-containing protein [Bacillota bacterium]
MKVSQLVEKLNLKVVSGASSVDSSVTGCYICDLLSRVMHKARPGDVWITVQTNINITAVAALSDIACVIIPEGIEVEQSTVDKSNEKNIVILSSQQDSFELAVRLNSLL